MVFVKVSETYDLSTKIGKMGIVGIHTPDSDLITRHYGGFVQNMKFAKFVQCDVAMACASMLPADPLRLGWKLARSRHRICSTLSSTLPSPMIP